MPRLDETAYRQLKTAPSERELRELYTPTLDERNLAKQHTTGKPALVAFLVLLKTFQHLGYAIALSSVPMAIVSHIATQLDCQVTGQDLITYDLSGTRRSRSFAHTSRLSPKAPPCVRRWNRQCARRARARMT